LRDNNSLIIKLTKLEIIYKQKVIDI